MTWPRWVLALAGLTIMGMGIQAYFFPSEGHTASPASLIAAGGSGLLLLICMFVSLKNPRLGYIPALVICLLLIGRFASSMATKGFKLYPDAIAIIIALITAGSLLAGHLLAQRAKKNEVAES